MNISDEAVEAALNTYFRGSKPIHPHNRADMRAALAAAAPHLLAPLVALAERWEAEGESDMAASKTVPDEDIAMSLLTHGADLVENARLVRIALAAGAGE